MLCSIGLSVLFNGIQVLELYYGQVLSKCLYGKLVYVGYVLKHLSPLVTLKSQIITYAKRAGKPTPRA